MKYLSVLLAVLSMVAYGQTPSMATTELTYEFVNAGLGERRTVVQLVNARESLSIFSASDTTEQSSSNDFQLSGEDALGRQVYRNSALQELIFRDFVSRDGAFEACIVKDPLSYSWNFGLETRKIGTYLCRKANTEFRGRAYTAWYCEELPVPHGPWKFSGLPGAIVEVKSADEVISFRLLKVKASRQPIFLPGRAREISIADFVGFRESATQDFINRLSSRLPRGAEISVNMTNDYNLETSFSDIKK